MKFLFIRAYIFYYKNINISDYTLSETQTQVLNKGFKFMLPNKKLLTLISPLPKII